MNSRRGQRVAETNILQIFPRLSRVSTRVSPREDNELSFASIPACFHAGQRFVSAISIIYYMLFIIIHDCRVTYKSGLIVTFTAVGRSDFCLCLKRQGRPAFSHFLFEYPLQAGRKDSHTRAERNPTGYPRDTLNPTTIVPNSRFCFRASACATFQEDNLAIPQTSTRNLLVSIVESFTSRA